MNTRTIARRKQAHAQQRARQFHAFVAQYGKFGIDAACALRKFGFFSWSREFRETFFGLIAIERERRAAST